MNGAPRSPSGVVAALAAPGSQGDGDVDARRVRVVSVTVEATDRMAWANWLMIIVSAVGALCAATGSIPVSLPMPTHAVGWVTPTCGLTRGTVSIMRGHFALAFDYNPVSFAVLPLVAAGLGRFFLGRLKGRWVNIVIRPTRVSVAVAVVAFIALGLYQQSHAMFIMHSARL